MKLTNWGDILKWSSEVLADDYNDGQLMVFKVKTKVENSGDLSMTAKHAHAKNGETNHKLATELKLKQKHGAGTTVEFALKNSGVQNSTCEVISDMKYLGLDMGKLKGVYKMSGLKNHQVGVELNDKDTIGRALVQLQKESPKFIGEVCHRYCNDLQVGVSGTISTKDMGLDSHKWEVAGSHRVGEGMMSGAKLHFSGKQSDFELNKI